MKQEEHRITAQDGIELYCRVHGDGANTLLCLPGLARTLRDFDGLARSLPPHWRVVCPDHRGRGRSGRDPKPARYHTGTYARDAVLWLDHLEIDQAVVLGSSFGGWVALTIAARHPKRVAGVILNDIGATVPRDAALQYMDLMARRPAADTVDPAFNRQMRQARRAAPLLGVLCRLGLMRHSAPLVRGFRDAVRGLDVPLLVLRGARSRVLTEDGVAELRDLYPELMLATVEKTGHTPTLTEPDALAAIQAFLLGLAAPGPSSVVRSDELALATADVEGDQQGE